MFFVYPKHGREDRDGLLSMWRGYGGNGNGAAIVFDTAALNVLPVSPLIIAKVEYATTAERLEWISRKLETFASLLGGMNLPDDKLFLSAHALFHRFKQFALFTKHKGFEEEKEWRIVYMREEDKEHRLSQFFSHFIGARGIAPKLKFKVAHVEGVTAADLSISTIADRIILGPSVSSPISSMTFKRLLVQHGEPELAEKVFASTIPFRASI